MQCIYTEMWPLHAIICVQKIRLEQTPYNVNHWIRRKKLWIMIKDFERFSDFVDTFSAPAPLASPGPLPSTPHTSKLVLNA